MTQQMPCLVSIISTRSKPCFRQMLIVMASVLFTAGCGATAEDSSFIVLTTRLSKPIQTWKELHEQHITMQQFDYSCGSAALATLLNSYFHDHVSEQEVLESIVGKLNDAEKSRRKKDGLTLLDLKEFAEKRGYQAVGVKLQASVLPKLQGPILVYLETKEYRHFAILRGIREDRVFLADSVRGNIRMSLDAFMKQWPGIALVLGKSGFGLPNKHLLMIQEESPLRNELRAVRKSIYTQ